MTVWIEITGRRRRVDLPEIPPRAGDHSVMPVVVDGKKIHADMRMIQAGTLSLLVEGRQYYCVLDGDGVLIGGQRFAFSIYDPKSLAGQQASTAGADGPRLVKAPMPGRVVRLLVEAGDAVEEHQGLVVIEAMKMQNELKSPKAGHVTKIAVAAGATVGAGDVLLVVD